MSARHRLVRGTAVVGLGLLAAVGLLAPAATAATAAEPAGLGIDDDGRPDTAGLPVTVTVPELGDETGGPFTVSDAQLRWGLNHEQGSAAFFGGCNFLMAGIPGADGDTHGGKVWSEADGFYRASEGDVRVVQTDASGTDRTAAFATRCQAPDGRPVSLANNLSTGAQVVVDGGSGTVDPEAGTATIRWTGTFTSVFYGGMTYWWASDPVLTVRADGTGQLTATAGGFGTSMEDITQWVRLPAAQVVLADLEQVDLDGGTGFRVVPRYLGVGAEVPGLTVAQQERSSANASHWGSFPASFVAFQVRTGQAAYWYTSGGQRDWAKPPSALYVSYDADAPVPQQPDDGVVPPAGAVAAPVVTAPASRTTPSGPGGGVARAATAPLGPPTDTAAPVAFLATSAATIGAARAGLVPDLADALRDPSQRLALMTTGLLLASAGTVVGFRKGWLAMPFRG
jgi:hypothetical protein